MAVAPLADGANVAMLGVAGDGRLVFEQGEGRRFRGRQTVARRKTVAEIDEPRVPVFMADQRRAEEFNVRDRRRRNQDRTIHGASSPFLSQRSTITVPNVRVTW